MPTVRWAARASVSSATGSSSTGSRSTSARPDRRRAIGGPHSSAHMPCSPLTPERRADAVSSHRDHPYRAPPMRHHSEKVEAHYREQFRAGLKQRFRVVGRQVGVSDDFTDDLYLESTVWPVFAHLQSLLIEPEGPATGSEAQHRSSGCSRLLTAWPQASESNMTRASTGGTVTPTTFSWNCSRSA